MINNKYYYFQYLTRQKKKKETKTMREMTHEVTQWVYSPQKSGNNLQRNFKITVKNKKKSRIC